MRTLFKKWRYQLMDRRMRIPGWVFVGIILAVPTWMVLASGKVSLPLLFTILGFVFLGLYFYILAGQRFFGKK
ncbi:MAG: hypothetical protein AAB486_03275 [Patescibacteria group bacterium]